MAVNLRGIKCYTSWRDWHKLKATENTPATPCTGHTYSGHRYENGDPSNTTLDFTHATECCVPDFLDMLGRPYPFRNLYAPSVSFSHESWALVLSAIAESNHHFDVVTLAFGNLTADEVPLLINAFARPPLFRISFDNNHFDEASLQAMKAAFIPFDATIGKEASIQRNINERVPCGTD